MTIENAGAGATENTDATVTNDQSQQSEGNQEKTESGSTLLTDSKTEPTDTDKTEGGKAGDGEKADQDDKGDKDKEQSGAPEKYEAFTLPEGITLENKMLDKFSAAAKENNLTQKQAQQMIDLAIENTQGVFEKQAQAFIEAREGWVEQIKADKDFGGERFDETVERANRALTTFGSPALVELLKQGYGDHPEIIKMFARVDKATGEDPVEGGSPPKSQAKSAAQVLYG